ncbi:MAG: beta-ketoacyl-ACP reductase [Candidatus Diapherotrites archaeon]|nr:beta-ketoacyl-ACP reductase [Candidatus Diapherotrites archaeon]
MEKKLQGKVAIVTGASRGIGKAIALLLAEQGAKLAVNYFEKKEQADETVKQIEKIGGQAIAIKADISSQKECEEMVKKVKEKFGKIDILVNNAAITIDKTFKNSTKEEWDKIMAVDLDSLFNTVHPTLKIMLEQGSGAIVNIASASGEIGFFGQVSYSAAKAGVIGFTKALAKEVASKGIRVNAVSPGVIAGTLISDKIPKEVQEKFVETIPLKRMGKPEEIAKAVLFLACDDSSYITGQVIGVNGGLVM